MNRYLIGADILGAAPPTSKITVTTVPPNPPPTPYYGPPLSAFTGPDYGPPLSAYKPAPDPGPDYGPPLSAYQPGSTASVSTTPARRQQSQNSVMTGVAVGGAIGFMLLGTGGAFLWSTHRVLGFLLGSALGWPLGAGIGAAIGSEK